MGVLMFIPVWLLVPVALCFLVTMAINQLREKSIRQLKGEREALTRQVDLLRGDVGHCKDQADNMLDDISGDVFEISVLDTSNKVVANSCLGLRRKIDDYREWMRSNF